MLAPSYKSAAELGISEVQKQALISVMHALQRQEFTDFAMSGWGTCICGKAAQINKEVTLVGGLMTNQNLHPLFIPNPAVLCDLRRSYDSITQAEAARAVRTFLVTGFPHWCDALHKEEQSDPLAIIHAVPGMELNGATDDETLMELV